MVSNVESLGIDPVLGRDEAFSRSVHALFDTRDHAEAARQDLIAAGIHSSDISVVADAGPAEVPDGGTDDAPGGFWETMKELFMPEDDRLKFAEGVRRGGVTLSVRTDTANHDRIIELLDRDGAVDLDEREEHWRSQGWTGYTAKDPLTDARTPSLAINADDEDMSYTPASDGTAGFAASAAQNFPVGEDVAPRIESPGALPASVLSGEVEPPQSSGVGEPMTKGLREVETGRRRVRSYTWQDAGVPPGGGAP